MKRVKEEAEDLVAEEDPAYTRLKERFDRVDEENKRLSKLLGLVQSYTAQASKPPRWLQPKARTRTYAGTACMNVSDLHLDEVVDPRETGGLNAYDRGIALQRLRRYADMAIDLGKRWKHDWQGALVYATGDFVSGVIHAELRETNEDVLPSSLVFWAPQIASFLSEIADFYGHVHVPVQVGNHGRLTDKPQAKRANRNSWDWLLMQFVQEHLKRDDRITWQFAQASYQFVEVYGRTTFQTHGDEVKGGNGIAGIMSPLRTMIMNAVRLGNSHGRKISYVVNGHWHTTFMAHQQGFCANGSMKGWDEYAAKLRLTPEPAQQDWWVETPERGVTCAAPLILQSKEEEGW